jgi:hypothetical protein
MAQAAQLPAAKAIRYYPARLRVRRQARQLLQLRPPLLQQRQHLHLVVRLASVFTGSAIGRTMLRRGL